MSVAKFWFALPFSAIALPFSALLACGGHMAPRELVDARAAYSRAAASYAPKLVPAELHVAREALDVAEREFADDHDSQDTIDSAYIAMRKAQRAEALGIAAAATASKTFAEREQTRTQQAIIENQQGKLQKTESQLAQERATVAQERDSLAKQKQITEDERNKRLEAEKKAQDAMDALSKSLAVKADTRGTVITLSGGVLFATGQATILPGAQAQLNQVADALKTQAEHHFTIEGHTDNQGSDAINRDLSNRRANAVRDYLVVRGVAAAAITAQGVGSTRPVADNKTTEGRAMNRRVEIIVDRPVTASN
jgi:outer membrane protein OmpA-like peptidoglycan-associated protein